MVGDRDRTRTMNERNQSNIFSKGFARGSLRNVLMAFSQSYVEHDLRKNKIVIPFFN
jgi:hypothetical protein